MGTRRGQRNRALRLQHLERLQAPGELGSPAGIDEAELRADLAPQRGAALACTVCHNVTETRLGLGRTKGLENLTLGPHGRELHTSGHPLSSTRCGGRAGQAAAYREDPAFYKFIRALDSYDSIIDKNTTLMLPADNELFKYLDGKQIPSPSPAPATE